MGVPVAPRNIFPSNIQGLPTWYEVRVSEAGHLGARGGVDLMVAMNPQTWDKDVASIEPGGYLFYDSTKPMPRVEVPRRHHRHRRAADRRSATREYTDPRQRQLFKNIIYVGALSALLDMDVGRGREADRRAVQGQGQADRAEHPGAAHRPRLRAARNFDCPLGARARSAPTRSATASSSRATSPPALGAVYGGATVCAWYPITPSSSLAEAFTSYCATLRVDPDDRQEASYAIVQAEDEIASIGMVIGAGWNGARAFTATSGPGISLMQEFLGLAYFAEIPAVIFDVQRGGPSTGMPTRTQQSRHPVLRLCLARRHQARAAVPRGPGRGLRVRRARPSISPTGCRRRSSSCSISTSA